MENLFFFKNSLQKIQIKNNHFILENPYKKMNKGIVIFSKLNQERLQNILIKLNLVVYEKGIDNLNDGKFFIYLIIIIFKRLYFLYRRF